MIWDYILRDWFRYPTPPPKYLTRRVLAQATAVTVDADYDVPIDYDLHTMNIFTSANSGAAQTVTSLSLILLNLPDTTIEYLTFITPATLNAQVGLGNPIIFPSGTRLRAEGIFSAGVNQNSVQLFVHGILIPRMTLFQG